MKYNYYDKKSGNIISFLYLYTYLYMIDNSFSYITFLQKCYRFVFTIIEKKPENI